MQKHSLAYCASIKEAREEKGRDKKGERREEKGEENMKEEHEEESE